MTTSQPIYLTDLQRCLPAHALAAGKQRGCWRTLDYESNTLAGTMLVAGEETLPPVVTYPLAVRGWHRLSIGVYGERWDGDTVVQVKLSGDPAFTVLTLKEGALRSVHDLFWKEADLTGQQIVFGQLIAATWEDGRVKSRRGRQAMVAHIKLEPMSDDEVRRTRAERAGKEHKRLFAHNDAHGFVYSFGAVSPEEIGREIEPYRDTDFSRLYWEAGMGDLLYYPGKAGRLPTCDGVGDFLHASARNHAESWRAMRERGTDLLRHAAEMTRAAGLEFHASYRMGGFRWPPPHDHWNGPGFFEQHPELCAVLRDGARAQRISYSFPETRRFVVTLLREVAQYPIDGICLIYVRRPPFVDYEPPVVEGFQRAFGLDPRALPETDPRWLEYRCGVLTRFMREVRQAMDAVARERRRDKIAITAIVSSRADENLRDAIKVEDWVAEGLVDTLIPYTMAPELDTTADSWPDVRDVDRWLKLTRGTSCRLSLSMLPRFSSPEDFRRKAAALYGVGADSLFFWDCAYRVNYHDQPMWNALRRLGHKDEIAAWMQAGQPPLTAPRTDLTRLGGWNLADNTPG
jgi:hypothetical protein